MRQFGRMNMVNAIAISNYDLTDLPRLLHVAKSVNDIVSFERLIRQRMQHAFAKQGHYIAKQFMRQRRMHFH